MWYVDPCPCEPFLLASAKKLEYGKNQTLFLDDVSLAFTKDQPSQYLVQTMMIDEEEEEEDDDDDSDSDSDDDSDDDDDSDSDSDSDDSDSDHSDDVVVVFEFNRDPP